MENGEKSPIVKTPNAPGVWWWRKDDKSEWTLADVQLEPRLFVRFFNGGRITEMPWGQWAEATVSAPPLPKE